MAEQIETLVRKYRVKTVSLVQDLFAVDGDWLADFLRAMEASSGADWSCGLRPDSVEVETLADMRRAECTYIFLGVESGSQRIQKLIGKNLDIARTCGTIEAAVACGIRIDAMIRQYPEIFSSFYYVKPESVSREEFLLAVWAGNALCAVSKGRIVK